MRDQIDLCKAGRFDIPVVGLDRDVVFEQGARFGAPVEALLELASLSLQSPIDGRRADQEQLFLHGGRQRHAFDRPRQPQRQNSFETHRARIACGFPDRRQRCDHLGAIGWSTPLSYHRLGLLRRWTIEQANGVFAIVVADLTELVENPGSQRLGYFLVSNLNRFEIIPSGLSTHVFVTLPGCCFYQP